MKTNIFSKVAVTMMTVALGAGVVGSISGTVAWFQYSTRSTVSYQGASAHCTENLQIRTVRAGQGVDEGWDQDITKDELIQFVKENTVTATYTQAAGSDGAVSIEDAKRATVVSSFSTGALELTYDGEWKRGGASADLAALGLTVSGTAKAGDKITISFRDGTEVSPVTSGELKSDEVASTLYKNPIYQYAETSKWGVADANDYVDIPLQFRVLDIDGNAKHALLEKNIYLSDLTIEATSGNTKKDISDAIRVAVYNPNEAHTVTATETGEGITAVTVTAATFNGQDATSNAGTYTFKAVADSPSGVKWQLNGVDAPLATYGIAITGDAAIGDTIVVRSAVGGRTFARKATTTNVYGTLDLNKDGQLDKDGNYSWATGSEITYGDNGKTAATTAAYDTDGNKIYAANDDALGIANDSDPLDIVGKPLGATIESADQTDGDNTFFQLNVRIYLEGWQHLASTAAVGGNANPGAIWDDAEYVDSKFNVGFRFSADAHVDHD